MLNLHDITANRFIRYLGNSLAGRNKTLICVTYIPKINDYCGVVSLVMFDLDRRSDEFIEGGGFHKPLRASHVRWRIKKRNLKLPIIELP